MSDRHESNIINPFPDRSRESLRGGSKVLSHVYFSSTTTSQGISKVSKVKDLRRKPAANQTAISLISRAPPARRPPARSPPPPGAPSFTSARHRRPRRSHRQPAAARPRYGPAPSVLADLREHSHLPLLWWRAELPPSTPGATSDRAAVDNRPQEIESKHYTCVNPHPIRGL
ncbi:unnamed protein product [Boreogadus saida]